MRREAGNLCRKEESQVSRVLIFDTTLRDGEQSPGVALRVEEKLEIARQLARLNVDVIEAGFPITSPGDFNAVRTIARKVKGPVIAALARTARTDIDRAWEAIREAERPRIHVFISTSDIHMRHMLRKSPEEVLESAVEWVRYARSLCPDVEFSAQDATRSDRDFLVRICTAAIEAGATTVNIPDTVGYTTPREYYDLITYIRSRVPNIDRAVVSVHCHNDLGLAVANSLAAIEAGAGQVEVTINGIGERAGNTSLEEMVMALRTRRDQFGKDTAIATEHIYRTSRMVSSLTGMPVQPNKAVVGANAFAHESGIHQDGVLKERTTYEIMKPEDIGLASNRLVLGKHSGRHAFKEKIRELGYNLDDEAMMKAFARFKELADKKKEISDRDLEAIIEEEVIFTVPEICRLKYFHVSSGNQGIPMATVVLEKEGREIQEAAWGDGPVDAVYRAIDRAVGVQNRLVDYSLKAITSGKDAQGEATVRVENAGLFYLGRGVSTDVIEASAKAYLNAVNKMLYKGNGTVSAPFQGEPKAM